MTKPLSVFASSCSRTPFFRFPNFDGCNGIDIETVDVTNPVVLLSVLPLFFVIFFFRFFSSSKPPPDILTLFISLSGEMCALPPPKEEEKKSCVEQKSQVQKKIRKTTEARKIAKLLYQKCVCVAHGKCLSFSFSFSFSLSLTLLIFSAPPRHTKRITRLLVLDTLFRASSFRSPGARSNERSRRVASR